MPVNFDELLGNDTKKTTDNSSVDFFKSGSASVSRTTNSSSFFKTTKDNTTKGTNIFDTLFQEPKRLGTYLARFSGDFKEARKSEENLKAIVEKLKTSDLDERQGKIAENILKDAPVLDNIAPPQTKTQLFGNILGTAAWFIPTGGILKGVKGFKVAKQAARAGVAGGVFGLAEGLSDDDDTKEIFKRTALGALSAATLQVGGVALGKGTKKTASLLTNHSKNLFKKLIPENPRFLMSVGARFNKDFGDEGKEIYDRLLAADRNTLKKVGSHMDDLSQAGLFDLEKEASYKLTDALEGRLSPLELPKEAIKPYEVINKLRNEIAETATKLGVRVRSRGKKDSAKALRELLVKGKITKAEAKAFKYSKTGKVIDRPFKAKANYFPHVIPSIEKLRKGNVRDAVIANSVRVKAFKTATEANKALDNFINAVENNGKGSGADYWINRLIKTGQAETKDEARGMMLRLFKPSRIGRFGQLEKGREFDFPFYDPDPRRVIPYYASGATQRLEEIPLLGEKFETINKLVGSFTRKNAGNKELLSELRNLIGVARGAIETSPKAERVSLFLRTLQVPKLAFAQALNIGQNINTLLAADAPSFMKGIRNAFSDEGRSLALRSGATLDSVFREAHRATGAGSKFGENFLRLTGFSAVEKANRVVAANVGTIYAENTFKKLLKNPRTIYRVRLSELGIDVNAAIKRGALSEDDLLMAAQVLSEKTQFRTRPIDLPAFMHSPIGKLAFQFKSFAFNQAKFLKNEFKKEVAANNYGGVARLLVIMSTIFPMTGEVLADVRSILTGQKRPTDAFDRYVSDFLTVGGFGILSDTIQSASYGRLAESILGATVGTATEGVERVVKMSKEGEIKNSDIKFILRQTGFGRSIANYAFPNDRKEQATFLKTLEEVFN